MTTRIAINGYGRIGRNVLRAFYEGDHKSAMQIVAVNNRADLKTSAHLTRYDTTHGRFRQTVEMREDDNSLLIAGDTVRFYRESDASALPWGELGVDVVLECSGKFCSGDKAREHLRAGARKVLISAPADKVDATVVYGVNHHEVRADHAIVSCASCTTNCLAPVAKILRETVGLEYGLITTVHAYTNDQTLIDASHKDLRRARSGSTSMIPTKTGAAKAVSLVLPELAGRLHGYAIRVPVLNVSLVDLTFVAGRATSADEINAIFQRAAQSEAMQKVLQYCDEPLVSIDYNHNPHSAVFDATLTQLIGDRLVKVSSWYDNEWAYSNRMLDMAGALMAS